MPRTRDEIEVTMFPFLSVLCTVIGVLVLFIVLTLSTRVVQIDERFQQTQSPQHRPQEGSPDAIEQGISAATFAELQAEITRLQQQTQERRQEQQELSQKLAGLEDLIEYKKTQQIIETQPNRGRPLVEREKVVVVPIAATGPKDNFEVKLRPVLVECAREGYTVHPAQQKFPAMVTATGDAATAPAPELLAFIKKVDKQKATEYIVYLVHPNGIEAFENLRNYVVENYSEIQVGWEPFSREWLLVNNQYSTSQPEAAPK